ncbi:MAG: hypothetical protein ACK4TI_02765 [Nitrososphaerales archaeon]
MQKREFIALATVLLITVGLSAGFYYLEFVYKPLALLSSQGKIWQFTLHLPEWNITEIKVSRGDAIILTLLSNETYGFYVEYYTDPRPVVGRVVIDFVASNPGTYRFMISTMILECHCWVTSPYREVGKLIVGEE